MKRCRAWHTTVSLDKLRLSSPIFPYITHSHWTPSLTAHSPTHPTVDGEAGGRHSRSPCLPFSLFLFFKYFFILFIFVLWSVFPFHSPVCHFLSSISTFSLPLASLHIFLSLSHYLSLAFLLPPLPSSSLLVPNSCCCARMGLNLTQVWMVKKKQLPAHLPHSFVF